MAVTGHLPERGWEGRDGLHRAAARHQREDRLPDEAALDGADLRDDHRRAHPRRWRRPVRVPADPAHGWVHRIPPDPRVLGFTRARRHRRGEGRVLVHPVVGRGLRGHEPEGGQGRRAPQQADQRRGAREDQRCRDGAGSARPDARLRDAQGGHRVGHDRPGLRDDAGAGRLPAGDARPEGRLRAGRRPADRRRGAGHRPGHRRVRAAADRSRCHPRRRSSRSTEDKLRSLAKMRDDGLITPEDYEAKKADLLADL